MTRTTANPHPKLENLAPPWKKGGPSPNPGGRPKKRRWTESYHFQADQPLPEEVRLSGLFTLPCVRCQEPRNFGGTIKVVPTGRVNGRQRRKCKGTGGVVLLPKGSTWAQAAALKMNLETVGKGNVAAAREMADRVEGTPPQRIQVDRADVKEIRFVVKYDNADEERDDFPQTTIERRGDVSMVVKRPGEEEHRSGPVIEVRPKLLN